MLFVKKVLVGKIIYLAAIFLIEKFCKLSGIFSSLPQKTVSLDNFRIIKIVLGDGF